jgi:hypothetical protein
MSFELDNIPSIAPVSFFQMHFDIAEHKGPSQVPFKKPYLLPHVDDLLDEDAFAKVAIAYHNKGIFIGIEIDKPFEQVYYPKIELGDGVEIFIDTRNLKNVGSLHKFCHHFVFLPKEVNGIQSLEVTRLRMEDSHPLCEPSLLHLDVEFKKNSYTMQIFIEADALFGYDLTACKKLGFTYKIHGKNYRAQHLNISSEQMLFEKYPASWACLNLI